MWYRLTAMSINAACRQHPLWWLTPPPLPRCEACHWILSRPRAPYESSSLATPIQGALWMLGNGVNLSLWQQWRENHTTGLRPEENKPTALSGDRNAPLLPTAPPPEGEVLAPICIEMFMSLEAERRENFPLRGKWCDSTQRGAFPARRRRGCLVFAAFGSADADRRQ